MWRAVTVDEFDAILADAAATAAFRDEFPRYDFPHDRRTVNAAVHDGSLVVDGGFRAPAFYTLVIGDLRVNGLIDLRTDWETGGLFVVLGNVRANDFLSDYDAGVFIDGDLDLLGTLVNAYSDSAFSVIGSLTARLHIGNDMTVTVGAGAIVDYAIGHRAALEADDHFPAKHSEAETIAAMTLPARKEGYPFDEEDVGRAVRDGKPLLKT